MLACTSLILSLWTMNWSNSNWMKCTVMSLEKARIYSSIAHKMTGFVSRSFGFKLSYFKKYIRMIYAYCLRVSITLQMVEANNSFGMARAVILVNGEIDEYLGFLEVLLSLLNYFLVHETSLFCFHHSRLRRKTNIKTRYQYNTYLRSNLVQDHQWPSNTNFYFTRFSQGESF